MLKIYRMPNGNLYQFEDGDVPAGAVLVEAEKKAETKTKAVKPANKARRKAATK